MHARMDTPACARCIAAKHHESDRTAVFLLIRCADGRGDVVLGRGAPRGARGGRGSGVWICWSHNAWLPGRCCAGFTLHSSTGGVTCPACTVAAVSPPAAATAALRVLANVREQLPFLSLRTRAEVVRHAPLARLSAPVSLPGGVVVGAAPSASPAGAAGGAAAAAPPWATVVGGSVSVMGTQRERP